MRSNYRAIVVRSVACIGNVSRSHNAIRSLYQREMQDSSRTKVGYEAPGPAAGSSGCLNLRCGCAAATNGKNDGCKPRPFSKSAPVHSCVRLEDGRMIRLRRQELVKHLHARPNKRLKLAAPSCCGSLLFVNTKTLRRSLGASR